MLTCHEHNSHFFVRPLFFRSAALDKFPSLPLCLLVVYCADCHFSIFCTQPVIRRSDLNLVQGTISTVFWKCSLCVCVCVVSVNDTCLFGPKGLKEHKRARANIVRRKWAKDKSINDTVTTQLGIASKFNASQSVLHAHVVCSLTHRCKVACWVCCNVRPLIFNTSESLE